MNWESTLKGLLNNIIKGLLSDLSYATRYATIREMSYRSINREDHYNFAKFAKRYPRLWPLQMPPKFLSDTISRSEQHEGVT